MTRIRTRNAAHKNTIISIEAARFLVRSLDAPRSSSKIAITKPTKINILHAKYHSDIPTFVIFLPLHGFCDAMMISMELCALHYE